MVGGSAPARDAIHFFSLTARAKEAAAMTPPHRRTAVLGSFNVRVVMYRHGSTVIEVRGAARRKTAGLLATVVRALAKPGEVVVVDLSDLPAADYWLVSALAKAHAAAQASRAALRLVVGCRPVLRVLESSGLGRLIPISRSRDYDDRDYDDLDDDRDDEFARDADNLDGSTARRPDRASARQRIIDLSTHAATDRGADSASVTRPRRARAWRV
jgi:anti-anti-sigma regulatory factor